MSNKAVSWVKIPDEKIEGESPWDGKEIIAYGLFSGDLGYYNDHYGWTGIRWDGKRWEVTQATGNYFSSFKPLYYLPNLPLSTPPADLPKLKKTPFQKAQSGE